MTLALILAAAAVAYLMWSRPVAPAGLPSLVPVIAAPAIPVSAAASHSPHPLTLLAILAAGGMVAFAIRESGKQDPTPGPVPAVGLDLRGRFVGPEAAADAATMAALLGELADVIAWDGQQTEPRLKTGAAIDDLRRTAREMRCRGVSIGARQPAVRDAVKAYIDQQVGTGGGPVDSAKRLAWVAAFRAVGQAAGEATR